MCAYILHFAPAVAGMAAAGELSDSRDWGYPPLTLEISDSSVTGIDSAGILSSDAGTAPASGETSFLGTGVITGAPSPTVSGSDAGTAAVMLVAPEDTSAALLDTQQALLASSQRLEQQNEACISILLIFLVVGLLRYIYNFFNMFF